MPFFWLFTACGSLTFIAIAFLLNEPSAKTTEAVELTLFVLVSGMALGLFRAASDLLGREDMSADDKKMWSLWLWLALPIAVPLYLFRQRL